MNLKDKFDRKDTRLIKAYQAVTEKLLCRQQIIKITLTVL